MADGGTITAEDLFDKIKPRTAEVSILLDQDLDAEHRRLQNEWTSALREDDTTNREPLAPALLQRIRDVEAECEAAKVTFRFKSVGRRAWQDLLAKHPPTKEQKRERPNADFDPQRFPAAAIAASLVEPALSVAQVVDLEEVLTSAQYDLLFGAAIDVNMGGASVPKLPIPGRLLQASGQSASTPAPGESLAPSSLDE